MSNLIRSLGGKLDGKLVWTHVLVLGVVLVLAGGFAWQSYLWSFLCDDAFISFRYARNWAETGQIVYNTEPLEFVEGYTNPLWVAILALGHGLGIPPHQFAPVLTRVFAIVGIIGTVVLFRLLRCFDASTMSGESNNNRSQFSFLDLGVAALLIAVPQFMVWSSSGLETGLVAALSLWSVAAFLKGRIYLSAILLVLVGLTRLDGLIWPVSWISGWVGTRLLSRHHRAQERMRWRSYALALAILVVPLLIHFMWRQSYYGSLLPNTWWIKRHGTLLSDSWGVWYLSSWVEQLGLFWVLPLLIAVRIRHIAAVIPLIAVLFYAWRVGGDFMAYHRFLLPATVSWAILICWLSRECANQFQRPMFRYPIMMIPFIVAAVQACLVPSRLERDQGEAWIDGRWESTTAMDRFAKIRFAAGQAMATRVRGENELLVSVGAAGAFPYASNFPVFDVYGLVDPKVAIPENHVGLRRGKSSRPGHQIIATSKYIASRQPDLQCHNGWVAKHRPSRKQARRRGGLNSRWLCVQTGSIPDHRAPNRRLDNHYYCCLAKKERIVEITQESAS